MKKHDKKDILFLCQFFYPEYNSSATLPYDTAKYLASCGIKTDVLCGYPKEYSKEKNVPVSEVKDGIGIRRIRYLQMEREQKFSRLINYFSFTFRALIRVTELKNYRCVVVYSNPPILPIVPIVAKKKYGMKLIFIAYDVYPEVAYASKALKPGSIISNVMKKLNHRLYKSADHVICLTDEMKEFLLKNRPELSEDRITTIENWAHEKRISLNHDAYSKFGYNEGQFIVSYFGNMGTCQDMDTLIGAMKELKDDDRIKFLIAGHGNKREYVIEKTKDLNNVRILEYLTGQDFEQAVAISSASVVSLERGLTGTCAPSKYYSYLQGGQTVLAVVEKDSYLTKEIKVQQVGYSVENGDYNGLAKIITDMAEDREIAKSMGKRAEKLYRERYSIDIAMRKYEEVIKSIIDI